MDLPECHAAAIEKVVDALIDAQEFPGAHINAGEVMRNSARHEARAAIAAYLSALKEQGLMRETVLYPVENIHWVTNTSWVGLDGRDGDTRALIIRMEPK